MTTDPLIKKLQLKDQSEPVLILNAPDELSQFVNSFEAEVHIEPRQENYGFVQAFGQTITELRQVARVSVASVAENGLLWLCYPKKSSRRYRNSDCSRDEVAFLLGDDGYEPVRQVALDDDWSALRFRQVDEIGKMTRSRAATQKGQERITAAQKDGNN